MYRVEQRRLCLAQVAGAKPGGTEDQGGDHRHVGAGLRLERSVDPGARRARPEISDRARLQERYRNQHRHGARRGPCPDRRLGLASRRSGRNGSATRPSPSSATSASRTRRSCARSPASSTSPRPNPTGRRCAWCWRGRPMAGRISCRPGVPPARAAALRRAFDATMRDPAFMAEAAAMKVDVDPMTGEAVQALVEQVHRTTPADVVERVRTMMAAAVEQPWRGRTTLRTPPATLRRRMFTEKLRAQRRARLTCKPCNLAMN